MWHIVIDHGRLIYQFYAILTDWAVETLLENVVPPKWPVFLRSFAPPSRVRRELPALAAPQCSLFIVWICHQHGDLFLFFPVCGWDCWLIKDLERVK